MKVSIQLYACTRFTQWIDITNIEAFLDPLRRRETQGYVFTRKLINQWLIHSQQHR